MNEQSFLTLKEMAMALKVKPSWLYAKNRETGLGTIPRIKVGKYIRYEPEKVMEWIKEQNEVAN
jgi:predicted DNA-binding transcriptional regulator AlpA